MEFLTKRLVVRKPKLCDAHINLYHRLWNAPSVMRNVGFPQGLRISRDSIQDIIIGQDDTPFDKSLLVVLRDSGQAIGECKMGLPNNSGISITDVKLLPEYWNKGYGKEIKNALCGYLFSQTECTIVEASPSLCNIASIKMQEACAGKMVRKEMYHFPSHMSSYTQDVDSLIFHIHKSDWMELFGADSSMVSIPRIQKMEAPAEKQKICETILASLPLWFGIPEANREYIEGVITSIFYAVFLDARAIGFFAFHRDFSHVAEIYVCGIHPAYHDKGLGSAVLHHIEKQLMQQKVKYLTVKTLSPQHPSKEYAATREFYKANGFEPLAEFPDLWGAANPCLQMIKRLIW